MSRVENNLPLHTKAARIRINADPEASALLNRLALSDNNRTPMGKLIGDESKVSSTVASLIRLANAGYVDVAGPQEDCQVVITTPGLNASIRRDYQ